MIDLVFLIEYKNGKDNEKAATIASLHLILTISERALSDDTKRGVQIRLVRTLTEAIESGAVRDDTKRRVVKALGLKPEGYWILPLEWAKATFLVKGFLEKPHNHFLIQILGNDDLNCLPL